MFIVDRAGIYKNQPDMKVQSKIASSWRDLALTHLYIMYVPTLKDNLTLLSEPIKNSQLRNVKGYVITIKLSFIVEMSWRGCKSFMDLACGHLHWSLTQYVFYGLAMAQNWIMHCHICSSDCPHDNLQCRCQYEK